MINLPKVRHVDFYPTEWLDGTADLSAEERGVYITLVAMIYSQGGAIPDDAQRLARRCNMHTLRFKTVRARLIEEGKLVQVGPNLTNTRAELELNRAQTRTSQARVAAKLGGTSSGVARRFIESPPEVAVSESHENKDIDEAAASLSASCGNEPNHQPPTTNHQPPTKESDSPLFPLGDSIVPLQPDEVVQAYAAYCVLANEIGLCQSELLPERATRLRLRLKEVGGLDGWKLALEKVRRSSHCRGQNDRGWMPDLEFLVTKSKFHRVMEGYYDDRKSTRPNAYANTVEAFYRAANGVDPGPWVDGDP